MSCRESIYPCVGLIVSGGHTTLYACEGPTQLEYLGGTIDDAAGEAFDKVGAMLGLPFPGGPAVSQVATSGNPKAHDFPRSLLNDANLDFSFSGLKTAVRYTLVGPGKQDFSNLSISDTQRADICASFQQAVIDCLVKKSRRAIRKTGYERLCVGGGVASNQVLRAAMADAADSDGFALSIAPPELCTDNAVMGAVALEQIKTHGYNSLDLDIQPGLQRGR